MFNVYSKWKKTQNQSSIKSLQNKFVLVLYQLIQNLNIPNGLFKQSLASTKIKNPKKLKMAACFITYPTIYSINLLLKLSID
jgi:hypothetical protein